MRHVGEPVAAEVRFGVDGSPVVRRFRWQDQDIPVTAGGRTWVDEGGRHVLVMGPDQRTYELLLCREDLIWYVERAAARRAVA
jgi:hypothetical protein